jgi:FAD/FMN-containing dehydrogenase
MKANATSTLIDDFDGHVIVPDDPGYDDARRVWNGAIDRRPAVVAKCASVGDVVKAVRFGRAHDLVIAVRCGGHSVGGFSTCDDGVLIDLSLMGHVEVDPERRVAKVGGGALLGALDAEAQRFDLACPVGVVSHTGVGGLTLGGGMGRLMRRYGLSVDNMLAVDLVTADGELVHASEDAHPELFWGVRGAGPNFGVVTSFEFQLHPAGPDVVHGAVTFSLDRIHDVAEAYRDAAINGPPDLFLGMNIGLAEETDDAIPAGTPVAAVALTDSKDGTDADRVLETLRSIGPLREDVQRRRYLSVQTAADEEMSWGKRFYMKGGFLADLTSEAVDVFVERVQDQPGGCLVSIWAQGGAIAHTPDDAMAFTGRNAPFWFGAEALWLDPAEDPAHRDWGRSAVDAMDRFASTGHYVNDIVETGEEMARSVYGSAKYDRLVALKREWDPDNVFRLNQNIKP